MALPSISRTPAHHIGEILITQLALKGRNYVCEQFLPAIEPHSRILIQGGTLTNNYNGICPENILKWCFNLSTLVCFLF